MAKQRENIYDYIRVISCLAIIVIHCTDVLLDNQDYGRTWWIGNIIQAFVRIALPMFVLLSGSLLLNNQNQETLGNFYMKRLIKIVIPLCIYSFIYIFVFRHNYSLEIFKPMNLKNAIKSILEGNVYYHLWFVYMIIGLYLCTPFLKKMCQSLTDKECQGLTILIFIISIIEYLLPSFKINIGINNIPFIEWTLVFLIGYLVTKETINKHYKLIYTLGVISLIFTIIICRTNIKINNLKDLSIFMLTEVMAVYLLFVRNKDKICKSQKLNKIMTFLSKYTWEIYLVHAGVLNKIELYIKKGEIHNLLWSLIMIILVPIVSLILAFIIHNIIIVNIERLINKLNAKKNTEKFNQTT